MRLLVTGGAGYIGSIVAQRLIARGDDVTVLDNLYRGHREAVPAGAAFIEADLLDADAVTRALQGGFDGVMHFAALSLVAESVENPSATGAATSSAR
jgi:UDP-glucose 4-epimerase